MKRALVLLTATCVMSWYANASQASLINVKFDGSYSGAAAVGSSGDYWNSSNTASGTNVSLRDSGNSATTVTMTHSGQDIWGGSDCFFNVTQYANLMDSYLYTYSSLNIAINGLAAGEYKLYLYSSSNNATRVATFTAATSVNTGGVSVVIGPNNGITTLTPSVHSVYDSSNTTASTYGVLDVTVGANGALTITTTGNSGETDLCGFQLQSVPEPASLALLISVALILAAYIQKRKR